MKGVKNYLKNVTKSIAYSAAHVAKNDLMPNVGDFVDSNKEFLATTYATLKNPKASVKKQINAFKNSKIYEAIDYGARNVFDDLKTGKFYNKEREDSDSLKFAGKGFDVEDWNDLSEFGVDNDWESKLDSNTKDEVTTGDLQVVNAIESSNKAVANTTANAIAAAAESNNKNSRVNTAMLFNQNERLFGGVHNDLSVLNATMDSIHKVVTQALPNIDKNMSNYFTEASKDRKEIIAMMKESLEIQRKTANDQEKEEIEKRKKSGNARWSDVSSNGMPDLSNYFGQVKKNIKKQMGSMGGMMDMMGEDSNMLAAFMANPLGEVMNTITKSIIPAGIKMATQELDKTLSSVFGTFIGRMANAKNNDQDHPVMAFLSKFLGINTSVDKNIHSDKYYKGAVPFDGITRKAIVDVIPSYLRRIEAAITKQEEKLFDYDKGSWRTVKSVQSDFNDIRKNAIKQATNNIMGDMNKGIDYVRRGMKSSSEKKEFSEALWEFQTYLYDHNGVINPKVSPEKNDITNYGPYSKFYKYYTEIMTIYMNNDFDLRTGRHKQLSLKMGISNDVLAAKDWEEQQYRAIEKSGHNTIAQIKAGGFEANKHGKFKGENKDKFQAKNMLLEMKDNLGNNMFDYFQKIAAELRFLRMDLANGTGFIAGSINGNPSRSISGGVLYDSGEYDLRKVLINKSFNDENTKKLKDQIKREEEERNKAEKDIRAGKSTDHDLFDINKGEYTGQLAHNVAMMGTKDYYDARDSLADENFISRYMNNKYYDPKLAKELSKLYDKADKEIKEEEKKEDKEESATSALIRKAKQARARFQSIIGAPAEIFENLLYTADRAIYDMMFKAEIKNEDDKDNPEGAKGFMDLIAKKVNKVLDKVSEKAHKDILDPLMKRLGIDDPKKFKEDVKDAFTNIGGQVIKKFLEANKQVYGSIYDKIKSESPEEKRKRQIATAKDNMNFAKYEREYFKNNPQDLKTRRAAMRALAIGDYNMPAQYNGGANSVKERREFLLSHHFIDPDKLKYYDDDAINKAYFRFIQQTHASGTMKPDGKPFKGLSTLHAGEAIFNSKGSGIVNKTGLYDITEPTHILNRYDTNNLIGIKNNKSKSSTIASDLADEKRLKNSIFHHPNGTENTDKEQQNKTEENINKAVDAVKNKYKDVKDIDYNSVKENAKLHLPEGIAGGAIGGIASTLLGIVGGPLIGALLGSAAGVISSSDQLKDQLFGKKDSNGKRGGGKLFGNKIMGFINKYVPDMGKFGLAGIIPGLITPLGPLGGMLVGAGIGFLKNNNKFMDKYFGEKNSDGTRKGGKLSLDSKSKNILKQIIPGGLKGAGVGALAKLVFGGPFGLLGNAAVGAAVGMITSTDAFKDNILGKMKDGVRDGGLVGEIRRAFDPLKKNALKIGNDMLTVFDKYIVDPLSRFVNPFINQLYLALSFIPKKIGSIMEEKIGKPIQSFFVDKVLRRFNVLFGGAASKVSGVIKGVASTFLNPFNILGAAGDAMKKHQIKIGAGVANSMTADERMEFMAKNIKRRKNETDEEFQARVAASYKGYGRDAALSSIGKQGGINIDQAKKLQRQIRELTDTDQHLAAARKKKANDIQNALRHWVRDGSDAKISPAAMDEINRALKNDNFDNVEKILYEWDLADTGKGESKVMTEEEVMSIMNGRNGKSGVASQLSELKDLSRRKKLLGRVNKSGKRESMTKDLIDKMNKLGFNVKDVKELSNLDDLLGTEITNREANNPKYNKKSKTKEEKNANNITINNEIAKANEANTKRAADALDELLKYFKEIMPQVKELGDLTTLDSDNEDLERSEESSLTGKYKNAAVQGKFKVKKGIKTVKNAILGRHNQDYEPDIEPVPEHGIGTFLLGGLKKIGSGIANGISSFIGNHKAKKNKAQSDIEGAANITNAFSPSNLDEVDKKGDGKDVIVNSTNGNAILMKRGSDGSVEPDTSDSKTKKILNDIEAEKKKKEELDQAQLRAAKATEEGLGGEQQNGKKMKWWQLLLYGMVAAPFIKKLFNNFLKPLWNDKLKPALGKLWEEKLLPGISNALSFLGNTIVNALPGLITSFIEGIKGIDWKSLIFDTAEAGGSLMDSITGNKDNAGASNTMSKEDFDNATGNSHLTDDTGREVTYEDIRNGNYQGQLRNEQGDAATINDDGSLTVKDNSKHGSSFLKKELNGMFHAAVRHNPGKMTTMLSEASSRILKRHGLTNKIVGLAGKAITEPIKFAAHPLQSIRNAGKAVNDTFNVTGKVQKASDFMGKVKDRIVNRAAYKQGSAMEHLINTTDTITENGVKKGSKIATMASKIKGGISNAGHKLATKVKSSKAATKIAEASGAVSSKIAKIVECVEGVVEKLFSNSKVAKKLADCAEAVGKSADNFISGFKKKVVSVFKNGIKKGGNKVEKSAVSKALGKVGSFVGKALGIVTIIFDFITGCDKAESILGVKETSIVEEVVSGVINALCNFFIIPAIVPGVNWIAQLLMGFFNKDLKSRQADADAELKAYNAENHTNYSKEEYLEMTKSVTGKVKVKAKEALKTVKGGVSKAWGAVKGTAGKAWNGIKSGVGAAGNAIKKGVSGAVNAIKEGASDTWENIKALPTKVTELFGFAKSGNLKSFYGYKVSEDKTIGTLLANNIINMIKTPLSFIALPASIISFFKKHSKEIGAQFKDTKGAVGTLFKYATSGNLKSFYGYSAVDKDGSITSKISNVITNILKVPMSLIALPAKGISILKSGIKKAIGQFKDIGESMGELFDYAKSGDLSSFYGYSAVDEDESITSKISNVITNIAKVPLSLVAIPAKVVSVVKDKFANVISTISEIKDNNDSVIDKAMNGEISVFSSDYWAVDNTQDGFVGGLETVYSIATRALKSPLVLLNGVFAKITDWLKEKIDAVREKFEDVSEFFDDPIGYISGNSDDDSSSNSSSSNASTGAEIWDGVKYVAGTVSKATTGIHFGFGKYGRGYDKQIDPSIANIRFNAPGDTEYQTIGDSACGPAAAVNAVKSAYGRGNDILSASKYALSNGYKEKNGGTKPGFFKDYFNKQGLDSSMSYDKSTLMKNIKSGKPTVLMGTDASSNGTPYGPNPHYVTVTGVDGRGNAIVQDPESNQDNQTYKINKLLGKSTFGVSVNGSAYGRGKYGRGNLDDMHIGQNGVNLICQFEGFMGTAYHGKNETYLTIGYGHCGPDVKSGQTITKEQAKQLLAKDAANAEVWVKKYIKQYSPGFEPTQNQFDALVSYVYNRGSGAAKELFENSKTAADYSKNIVIYWGTNTAAKKGLDRRRKAEQALFNSDAANFVVPTGDTGLSGSTDTTSTSASTNPIDSLSSILDQTKAGKALSAFTSLLSGGNNDASSTTATANTTSGGIGPVTAVAPSQAAEAATKQMEDWANDDSHGYDQSDRWGNPDFDCSGAVISAWTKVGVDVKSAGASYTGDMYNAFIKMGFVDVIKQVNLSNAEGMQRGDVLLSNGHTAMYCGNGKLVHASISENGTIHGKPGDQTGKEFCIRSYYNKPNRPWIHVLRYNAGGSGKYGRGKGNVSAYTRANNLLTGFGKAVAMSGKGKSNNATNSYKAYSNSLKSSNNTKSTVKAFSSTLNGGRAKVSSSAPVKHYNSSSNNINNSLLNVIINILESIADNTDKLNVIVELLNERLGTNISNADVSQKAMNKESIKSKLRHALVNNNSDSDYANRFGGMNNDNMNQIINTMNAIASE